MHIYRGRSLKQARSSQTRLIQSNAKQKDTGALVSAPVLLFSKRFCIVLQRKAAHTARLTASPKSITALA